VYMHGPSKDVSVKALHGEIPLNVLSLCEISGEA
jgi:hypothetical protein